MNDCQCYFHVMDTSGRSMFRFRLYGTLRTGVAKNSIIYFKTHSIN